jgi:predicted aminopeptidase
MQRWRAPCLLLLLMLLGGCETLGYYRQGIAGQLAFYGAREPIAQVLQKPDLPAETRRKLELVPQITAFAKEELKLPLKGQYRDYVQLPSSVVLWSVFAAPSLSLEPYRWCYGFRLLCVEYRGYFSLQEAQAYAAKLAAKGYDVHIGGVSAFSSLGLFDDPVTSVLTGYPDDLLASVLFHELAHSVLYVGDDTAFNESFASAVADEGLTRWRVARGAAPHSDEMQDFRSRQRLVTEVALEVRGELAALYALTLPPEDKQRRKHQILAGAQARYLARCGAGPNGPAQATCSGAAWFAVNADGSGLNNARLNAVATYEHLVPAFSALLRAHAGDLAAFYDTVEALGDMPREQRERILRAMALPPAAAGTGEHTR